MSPRTPRHPGLVETVPSDAQALLVMGFGGPEGRDEVVPFLERVTAGRGIPRERLIEVGAHYELFGGVSPINAQTRSLVAAVVAEIERRGLDLPVYWGNRNAAPFVADTVAQMAADGITEALLFATSSFASYSGCRQYREDVAQAVDGVDGAPSFAKLRNHGNHPGFVEPMGDRLRAALHGIPAARRDGARIVFTAHSIPMSMADSCDYEAQLHDSATLVMAAAGQPDPDAFDVVWQSRSGPPQMPWLEPDIGDHLRALAGKSVTDVVLVPLGFVSDHVEVLYDLDVEAQAIAGEVGMHLVRARTVGADPRYAAMIVDLFLERQAGGLGRLSLGDRGAPHDICLATCCPNLRHPETPAIAQAD